MAKRKTSTKKEITKPSDELDLAPTVSEVVEALSELGNEVIEVEKQKTDEAIYGVFDEVLPPSKEDLQASYDQEVKDLLIKMGEIQSKYQQIGRTKKAKALRDQKRVIQGKYKEWK